VLEEMSETERSRGLIDVVINNNATTTAEQAMELFVVTAMTEQTVSHNAMERSCTNSPTVQ
jgi:hypothetical protein